MSKLDLKQISEIVHNAVTSRMELFKQLQTDTRRDIDKDCGYPNPDFMTAEEYKELYDKDPIAKRIVEIWPKEAWEVSPSIYELETELEQSPFEAKFKQVCRNLRKSYCIEEESNPFWEYLLRADILSGIGTYGVILLGLNDGLPLHYPAYGRNWRNEEGELVSSFQEISTETNIVGGNQATYNDPLGLGANEIVSSSFIPEEKRNLNYMRIYPENLVQITNTETNKNSPRFQFPTQYQITLNDPKIGRMTGVYDTGTVPVHWSRVIHIADNLRGSEIFGTPRMKQCLPMILDGKKIRGGSSEMFWQGGFPGISFETLPQLGPTPIVDESKIRRMVEDYMNGLQRYLVLKNMSAKSLSQQIADPRTHHDIIIEAICIVLEVPVRIFKGSERGELASSQDEASMNDRKKARQQKHITPRIICPTIDRLIHLGVLPVPINGYSAKWPSLESTGEEDKARIAQIKTTTLTQYSQSNLPTLIPPEVFFTQVMGMDFKESEALLDQGSEYPEDNEIVEQENEQENKLQEPGNPVDSSNQDNNDGEILDLEKLFKE